MMDNFLRILLILPKKTYLFFHKLWISTQNAQLKEKLKILFFCVVIFCFLLPFAIFGLFLFLFTLLIIFISRLFTRKPQREDYSGIFIIRDKDQAK